MSFEQATEWEDGPIRVFLLDDHAVVRRGLSVLLESEPDMEVCGEAADVETAAERFDATRPDVIVVDLNLGDDDGTRLLRYLRDGWVGSRAVVLSQHRPEYRAEQARQAGAMGYVCKEEDPDHIVQAIRAAYRGRPYF